jgi:hypothetical protein
MHLTLQFRILLYDKPAPILFERKNKGKVQKMQKKALPML